MTFFCLSMSYEKTRLPALTHRNGRDVVKSLSLNSGKSLSSVLSSTLNVKEDKYAPSFVPCFQTPAWLFPVPLQCCHTCWVSCTELRHSFHFLLSERSGWMNIAYLFLQVCTSQLAVCLWSDDVTQYHWKTWGACQQKWLSWTSGHLGRKWRTRRRPQKASVCNLSMGDVCACACLCGGGSCEPCSPCSD